MNELNSMEKIKTLRQRLGYSQEELAEKSGLSPRTIQRIENGETEPRGDSLKRISAALGVTPNEIVDWTVQEDNRFLGNLNISALMFLLFPLLGIIVPYILWSGKRDTVKGAERTGKEIINFQITWNILVFLVFGVFIVKQVHIWNTLGDLSPTIFTAGLAFLGIGMGILVLYNIILILCNQVRILRGKNMIYFPKINFIQ